MISKALIGINSPTTSKRFYGKEGATVCLKLTFKNVSVKLTEEEQLSFIIEQSKLLCDLMINKSPVVTENAGFATRKKILLYC